MDFPTNQSWPLVAFRFAVVMVYVAMAIPDRSTSHRADVRTEIRHVRQGSKIGSIGLVVSLIA